jgi:hypothetical protein
MREFGLVPSLFSLSAFFIKHHTDIDIENEPLPIEVKEAINLMLLPIKNFQLLHRWSSMIIFIYWYLHEISSYHG